MYGIFSKITEVVIKKKKRNQIAPKLIIIKDGSLGLIILLSLILYL